MWHVSRKTNSASQHTALFVSAAFIGICQANSLKSCLSVIAFMPDCGNSLPYLKGSFQQEPVSRPARCTSCGSSLQLYAQTWVVTLHFWSFSSSHSHCFKHCDAVTEQWFYLGLTGPVVSLSGLRTPPPLPPLAQSRAHCLRETQTHTCHAVSPAGWPRPEFHSRQSSSGSVELAGARIHLPPSTHVITEKRDKLDLHVSSRRTRFLKLLADMDAHLELTRKTPLRPLYLLYFPRLLLLLFFVGSQYFMCVPGQRWSLGPRSSAQFSSEMLKEPFMPPPM